MNYAEIKTFDVANGPGIRVSLFVSGCNHRCPGCFNEQAWDFNFGQPFTQETIDYIIDTLSFGAYQGVTFLGGEPMEPVNQKGLLPLARKIKETYPEKDIWCFTGYDFEKDIIGHMYNECPKTKELLSYIDVLVDGPFIEAQKNLNLVFRGSENQRLIRIPETLKTGNIVLWEKEM
ncbi:anaerobic ribonucleoside-triphosphate reductase activating protein [Eubacterium ventriosum]|uniref:anaerobic ribonucleoside-triphosphate reductase activating protein n=1 Tax=Eubacterium ventriosum TaxID=39496 RepID=UPI003993C12E